MQENIIQKIVDNQDKITAVELDGVHYKVDFISDVTTTDSHVIVYYHTYARGGDLMLEHLTVGDIKNAKNVKLFVEKEI